MQMLKDYIALDVSNPSTAGLEFVFIRVDQGLISVCLSRTEYEHLSRSISSIIDALIAHTRRGFDQIRA